MPTSQELYSRYKFTLQKIADVKYASAVLQWDQETYLPSKGNGFRGRQIATLTEAAHEQFTAKRFGQLLSRLNDEKGLSNLEKRNVELSLEDYHRNKKLPVKFVRKLTEAINKSFHAWINARKENSFAVFQQALAEVIKLKKQEASYLGFESHPYNALMNDYDKGLTVTTIDNLFMALRPQLTVLLNHIKEKEQVDNSFLLQHFDKDQQWKFGMHILKEMQFDFEAGRQDISEHPFTTSFNRNDVRVTTRINEDDFGSMTWSCLHEGGHALYEQGLPEEEYGLPLGEYCSLSTHESQSRLWENCVGRSLEFWKDYFPLLTSYFPSQFKNVTTKQFYQGINKVEPSLIRTEADELTYHFHIMIRYEIEKQLIEGTLSAKDIPAVWNELYKKYLGITVPDDRQGCLQDVHWSHGSFGYFPTYSVGSLYASHFFHFIMKENGELSRVDGSEKNQVIIKWLQQHVYKHGRFHTSGELCRKATGTNLETQYFIDYVTKKYSDIYK